MQLYPRLKPARSWPGPVHDLLASASLLQPGCVWGRNAAPPTIAWTLSSPPVPLPWKANQKPFWIEVCCSCFPDVLFHPLNTSRQYSSFNIQTVLHLLVFFSISILVDSCWFSCKFHHWITETIKFTVKVKHLLQVIIHSSDALVLIFLILEWWPDSHLIPHFCQHCFTESSQFSQSLLRCSCWFFNTWIEYNSNSWIF